MSMPPPLSLPPASPCAAPPVPATLGERLALARQARFVGRLAECARFERMLAGLAEPVWLLHGPGGMGKTTLLTELARRAEVAGRIVIEVDARHMQPSPDGWRQALRQALGEASDADRPPPASVLLVDTFEAVASLQAWLRSEELPRYPADVLVVLAGRTVADTPWRLDAGWSQVAAVTRLGPWSPAEAQSFLGSRLAGQPVPARLLDHGAGVPLLLALLAEAHRHGQGDLSAVDTVPEADLHGALVRALLERFASELSDPAMHAAFHTLLVARSVTLEMLADTVDPAQAQELWAWLGSLPFVQHDGPCLQMHDFVREAFAASWTARRPEAIDAAGLRVQQHLARRVPLLGRDEAQRHLHDWIFVLRFTPVAACIDHRHIEDHALQTLSPHARAACAELVDVAPGEAAAVPGLPVELADLLDLVHRRLGPGLHRVACHWLRHRPGDFRLVRHRDGRLVGALLMLELTEVPPQALAADPAAARLWAHVQQQRPPQPGGSVWCCRFMVDATGDTLPLPTVTLAGMWLTQRTLTHPRAEWNLALHHNTEAMAPLYGAMTRLNWAHRSPALDDVHDGCHQGAFVRDCVREPIGPQWRPRAMATGPGQPAPLGRDDFDQAVREALRQCQRDEALATNPLCHSAMVRARLPRQPVERPQTPQTPHAALRQLLTEAVDALSAHPADQKFHRALRATWLVPGAKQEAVASELGLPFNTYRYHLARGAERLAQALWPQELLARQAG